MIKLYTVLRTGEVLKVEVFRGLCEGNYDLIPIISEGDTKYINMARNWDTAFKLCKENIFIGMDSDVILEKGIIEKMTAMLKDFIWVQTKPGECTKPQHGLFAFKKSLLEKVLFEITDVECPMCLWIRKIKEAGFNITFLANVQLVEI